MDWLKNLFGGGGGQQSVGGMSLPGTRIDSYGSNTGLRLDYQGSGPAWIPSGGSSRPAPAAAPAPKPLDDYSRQMAALQAQLNATLAELNRPGKVLGFDPAGALARARQQAESSTSPYYNSLINNMIAQYNVQRDTTKTHAARDIQAADTALGQTLEDIGTNRERTTEDVAQNLANIDTQQEQFQQDTGEQFDVDRQKASSQLAEAGLSTSGLGAQQLGMQERKRNTVEARQEQQFQLQENMQKQFKNRTFEDLFKKEGRSKEQTAFQKEGYTFDMNQALKTFDLEQTEKHQKLEKSRLDEIAQRSTGGYQAELGRFLAEQGQRGARGKDLEATRAAYGSYA